MRMPWHTHKCVPGKTITGLEGVMNEALLGREV